MSDNFTNGYSAAGVHLDVLSTDDFAQNQVAPNYRAFTLQTETGGNTPLITLLGMIAGTPTQNQKFTFTTLEIPKQVGTFTATQIYSDVNLSSAKTGAAAVGDIVYMTLNNALVANHLVEGATVRLEEEAAVLTNRTAAEVVSIARGSTTSVVGIKIDQVNAVGDFYETSDTVARVGTAYGEAAEIPDSTALVPDEIFNYTQKFWTPFEITPEAEIANLIFDSPPFVKQMKLKFLEHQMDMERTFIWGERSRTKQANTKSKYKTRGLVNSVPSGNISNYVTATGADNGSPEGKSWLAGGLDWFNHQTEKISRIRPSENPSNEWWAFTGNTALISMTELARSAGQIMISPQTKEFGLAITKWITDFGTFNVFTHPMFNSAPGWKDVMLFFQPPNLEYRYLSGNGRNLDTAFYSDNRVSESGIGTVHAKKHAWLTVGGLEIHFPDTMGLISGFGKTNTQ